MYEAWKERGALEELDRLERLQDARASAIAVSMAIFAAVAAQIAIAVLVAGGISSSVRVVVGLGAICSIVAAGCVLVLEWRSRGALAETLGPLSAYDEPTFARERLKVRVAQVQSNEFMMWWMHMASLVCVLGGLVSGVVGLAAHI
jgi:hypothetical protein